MIIPFSLPTTPPLITHHLPFLLIFICSLFFSFVASSFGIYYVPDINADLMTLFLSLYIANISSCYKFDTPSSIFTFQYFRTFPISAMFHSSAPLMFLPLLPLHQYGLPLLTATPVQPSATFCRLPLHQYSLPLLCSYQHSTRSVPVSTILQADNSATMGWVSNDP